ncbi:hypothetical protein ACHAW5_009242 [Stephanodiscus triporus]|uniref:ubiquitinyl hydrolase 1 n=1 Tax=Stephanodiscus triporus TaxID=2934178 RepID=A0ABD3NKM0_9STRA
MVVFMGKSHDDDYDDDRLRGDLRRGGDHPPPPPFSSSSPEDVDVDDELSRFARLLRSDHRPPLEVVRVDGDGNCLFRAVSLQVYGDATMHAEVRRRCLDFMEAEAEHYRNFVAEDEDSDDGDDGGLLLGSGNDAAGGCRGRRGRTASSSSSSSSSDDGFRDYVARKRRLGEHGNHAEIQAMSELYNRSIEVYVPSNGVVPINIFQSGYARGGVGLGEAGDGDPEVLLDDGGDDGVGEGGGVGGEGYAPIRLCYTNGEHYDALIDPMLPTAGLGLGLPGLHVGLADRMQLEEAKKASIEGALEEKMRLVLEESRRAVREQEEMEIGEALRISSVVGRSRGGGKSAGGGEENDMYAKKAMYLSEMEAADFDLEQAVEFIELVMNGFDLSKVLRAYDLIGDNFDDLLSFLLSSTSRENEGAKWE